MREAVKEFEEIMTAYDAAVEAAREEAGDGATPEPVPEPELTDKALIGGKAREMLAEGSPVRVCVCVCVCVHAMS